MAKHATLNVGLIGLGAMGMGMARSLVRAGIATKAYDIRSESIADFVQSGGVGAASVAAAAADADVLIVVVVNSVQADDVLFGAGNAVASLAPGSVVMLCSTVSPAYARTTSEKLAAHGIDMLDAPISGGPVRSAEGALSVMASGKPDVFEKVQPVLDAVAANVFRMGDEPGLGSTMKLVNQVLAGVHIATAAEAIAFGARAGIDPQRIFEVITASAGNSWMFQNRVPHILANDYTPLSAVDIWPKDLGLVLDTAKEIRLPMPLAAAAQQLFMAASASGWGRLDDAAVIKVYEKLANFDVVKGE